MDKLIIILLVLLSTKCFCQVFNKRKLCPGIKIMKELPFNGNVNKGNWFLKYYDHSGRMVASEYYEKRELINEYSYEYDKYNNEALVISLYNIKNSNCLDTCYSIVYNYDDNGQILRQTKSTANNITTIEMIDKTKNLTVYRHIRTRRKQAEDIMSSDTTIYSVTYGETGQIIQSVRESMNDELILITDYTYYPNGNLRRNQTTQDPLPRYYAQHHWGEPTHDTTYEYSYDDNGRVKIRYSVFEGNKYIWTKYSYEEW